MRRRVYGVGTTSAAVLAIVLLIAGLAGGYFVGATAPAAPPQPTTVTRTQTVTTTATLTSTVTVAPSRIEYVIGMPMAVTGAAYATEGPFRRDAAILAIENLNQLMELSGSPVRFKAIFEDSKGTAEGALAALEALAAAGAKIVVGPFSSGEVRAVKGFVDARKIVLISPSSTAASLAAPGDFVYRLVASDLAQARALAQLISELGFTKVGVIARADDYGKGIADIFTDIFAKRFSGQAKSIKYTTGQPDYSSEVNQLAQIVNEFGADAKTAVLIVAFDEDGLNILNHARLNPVLSKVRWFGSESLKRPSFLPPKAPQEVGAFLVKAKLIGLFPSPAGTNPVLVAFEQAYKQRFNKDPTPYSYFTYDAVWIAALAILAAGKYDGEAIAKALPQVSSTYLGASGYKKLDANGDVAVADYQIWRVTLEGTTYSQKVIGNWIAATETVRFTETA